MPRLPADEPLKKVTLNLYASDVDFLQCNLGWGYSERIRECVRSLTNLLREAQRGDHGE